MARETETGISRMLRVVRELGNPTRSHYNISGSATAAAFGRGGTPEQIRIISYDSQEAPNITGSAAGVGLGRGGVPRETGYISYKTQEEESDKRRF